MGLIISCCCSEEEKQNSRVWSVDDTSGQIVGTAPHLGENGIRPASRVSDASIRSWSQNQVPQNERYSHPSGPHSRDLSIDSASRQSGLPPLHVALYSHYNLSQPKFTYNTEIDASELREGTSEYELIKRSFMNTTQSHYRVIKITRINNMFIRLFYLLKKEEYHVLYGRENVNEEMFFHGSTLENIVKICYDNFNWRYHSKQCRFGNGVNFSKISNYASNYSDKSPIRFMLAANVLICRTCEGTSDMTLPPYYDERVKIRYDTSQKPDGRVTVKYNDDEFYPEYVIHFSGEFIEKQNNTNV